MATQAGDASVYNANTNWDNERKYLNNLISSGQAPNWAATQLAALESAHAQYNPVTAPVTAQIPQVAPTPALTGASLGDLYGLNYDFDSILDIFSNATQKQYAALEQDMAGTENAFYNNLAGALTTGLEALKQNNSAAIATGATQGLSASSALSLLLGLQQDTTDEATLLANDRNTLSAEKEAALAQNSSDALEMSNMLKQTVAGLDLTKYGYDTESVAAKLSYLAQIAAANAEIESAGIAANATKYVADSNKSSSSYGSGSGTGSGTGTPATGTPTTDASGVTSTTYRLADGGTIVQDANGTYTYTATDGQVYNNVDPNYARKAINNNSGTYITGTPAGASTGTVLDTPWRDGATVTINGEQYTSKDGKWYKPWSDPISGEQFTSGVTGQTMSEIVGDISGNTKITIDGKTYTYQVDSGTWKHGNTVIGDKLMQQYLSGGKVITVT